MSRPVRVTGPTQDIVTLQDLREHLRLDGTEEDALLERMASAAASHIDGPRGTLGRCLVTQTWSYPFSSWADELCVPLPDVSAVTVKYRDENDAEQTVDAADFEIVPTDYGTSVFFRDFTAPTLVDDREFPISVEVTAGYGAPSDVPMDLQHAVKVLAAYWFDEARAGVSKHSLAPMAFDALVGAHRWVGP